jgi:hypothetical protein
MIYYEEFVIKNEQTMNIVYENGIKFWCKTLWARVRGVA